MSLLLAIIVATVLVLTHKVGFEYGRIIGARQLYAEFIEIEKAVKAELEKQEKDGTQTTLLSE